MFPEPSESVSNVETLLLESSELCGHQATALGRLRELIPNCGFDFSGFR